MRRRFVTKLIALYRLILEISYFFQIAWNGEIFHPLNMYYVYHKRTYKIYYPQQVFEQLGDLLQVRSLQIFQSTPDCLIFKFTKVYIYLIFIRILKNVLYSLVNGFCVHWSFEHGQEQIVMNKSSRNCEEKSKEYWYFGVNLFKQTLS